MLQELAALMEKNGDTFWYVFVITHSVSSFQSVQVYFSPNNATCDLYWLMRDQPKSW